MVWTVPESSTIHGGHLAALGLRCPMETHLDTHAQRGKDS
jgi:hypothetical protein